MLCFLHRCFTSLNFGIANKKYQVFYKVLKSVNAGISEDIKKYRILHPFWLFKYSLKNPDIFPTFAPIGYSIQYKK